MPIIKLDLVIRGDSEKVSAATLQSLANELGDHFGSGRGGTWVKLDYLDFDQYAENGGELDTTVRPTFVEVLMYELPGEAQLMADAERVAQIVARQLGRPMENTHVVYSPEGKGRIAFGGKLVT